MIDAGGRNSLSLKKFKLKQKPAGKVKIAFAAHWHGAQIYDDYCFMHVSDSGYTGISSIGKDKANVVLVVNRNSMNGENGEDMGYNEETEENEYKKSPVGNEIEI